MHTITSEKAKDQFGTFISTVQREPVAITNHGRRVAVTLSSQDFEALGGNEMIHKLQQKRFQKKISDEPKDKDTEALITLMCDMQKEAKEKGLTQEKLDDILHASIVNS
ncbi:MAG: type II toxin-antitoxin system Phd/YefM family antitoxin [Pseudomonadota bacterium]